MVYSCIFFTLYIFQTIYDNIMLYKYYSDKKNGWYLVNYVLERRVKDVFGGHPPPLQPTGSDTGTVIPST